MNALQAVCTVGAMAFAGMIDPVGGNTSRAAELGTALRAALPTVLPTARGAALGPVPGAASGPSLIAKADIADDSIATSSLGLAHHDAAQPVPTTRGTPDDVANPATATRDLRYLTYYVWSELPPAEKPAAIVLSSLKGIPVGTPI